MYLFWRMSTSPPPPAPATNVKPPHFGRSAPVRWLLLCASPVSVSPLSQIREPSTTAQPSTTTLSLSPTRIGNRRSLAAFSRRSVLCCYVSTVKEHQTRVYIVPSEMRYESFLLPLLVHNHLKRDLMTSSL